MFLPLDEDKHPANKTMEAPLPSPSHDASVRWQARQLRAGSPAQPAAPALPRAPCQLAK